MPRPTVVVTRPAGQSRQLTEALLAAGVDVLSFPLLTIGPAADEGPLREALARLDDFALAVFVSPNAIAYALDALAQVQGVAVAAWPAGVPVAVVGPASVAALAERGIAAPGHRVIAPAGASIEMSQDAEVDTAAQPHVGDPEGNGAGLRFDSEALWAQLEPATLAGRRVLIVRGNGGRDWLADQLRAAGAEVHAVEAYRRSMPIPGAMQWHAVRESLKPEAAPHAWLLTSSEAVRNLDTLAREHLEEGEFARLREAPCIVPHARIAEQAAALGFGRVIRAAPGDDGLLAACLQWAAPHIAPPEQFAVKAPATPDAAVDREGSPATGAVVAAPAIAATAVQVQPQPQPQPRPGNAAPATMPPPHAEPPAAAATAAAPSPTPSTKVDRVTQDNTTSTSAPSPGATPPPIPPSGPATARAAGAGRFPWGWLVLAVMLVALAGAFWWLQQRVDRLTDELARRQQTNDALVQETRVLSRQAQELVKEMQAKVGGLEAQVGEARDKQAALEQVYHDLMRNRDDWEVAEIQQLLTNAGQQLQLTGNVQVALSALQSADMRLARSDKPQYNLLRRAIARDIARMKAVPDTDLTGAAIKLDEAINQVDLLPLLSSERMLERSEAAARTPASAPAAADAGNPVSRWFAGLWETVRDEFMQVIRVRRVDDSEALLLSGDQGWFLRENVKLRLLNARLALLSRNEPVFRNDLAAAQAMISRYFDTKSRRVQGVQTLLKQAQAGAVTVQLPTMAESLGALHALKKE